MPIPAEAWRQEKALVFVRAAVACPHTVMAFDRSQARGEWSHRFEAKRGVRAGTPDTLLIARIDGATRHVWAEWKAGRNKPNDTQLAVMAMLRDLGDDVTWCATIDEYRLFLQCVGVPMVANAAYLALHYDGMVASRIAKAEVATPKKARARKAAPRTTATLAFARRAAGRGILV